MYMAALLADAAGWTMDRRRRSMPIESGRYCPYCTDADDKLQPFEERFGHDVALNSRSR